MTNSDHQQEIVLLQAAVGKHCQKNRVPINPKLRKCIDGRYSKDQSTGAASRPGGDWGTSMALLNLGFKAKEAFQLVYNFVTQELGGQYGWHTDSHAQHHQGDGVMVGCGHAQKAIEHADRYGITVQAATELAQIIEEKTKTDQNMICETLDGNHEEQAILLNMSLEETIRSLDPDTGVQYFIYDRALDEQYLQGLVEFSTKAGTPIEYSKLLAVVDAQNTVTLGMLASSKGKPMFTVKLNRDNTSIVEPAGFVPEN